MTKEEYTKIKNDMYKSYANSQSKEEFEKEYKVLNREMMELVINDYKEGIKSIKAYIVPIIPSVDDIKLVMGGDMTLSFYDILYNLINKNRLKMVDI